MSWQGIVDAVVSVVAAVGGAIVVAASAIMEFLEAVSGFNS